MFSSQDIISIVIPVYNEALSLPRLYSEITESIKKINSAFEILFIDDGSCDCSLRLINEICERSAKSGIRVKCVHFSRNRGKSECLSRGFEEAKGDIIITMDADLQDNPEEIPRFLEKMGDGYDLVCGWRAKRKDRFSKIFLSRLFNILVSKITGIPLHDFNCGFKALRRKVIGSLNIYDGLHRFIPVLAVQGGFRVAEITIEHRGRSYGKSKYGLKRIPEGILGFLIVCLKRTIRK